MPGFVIWFRVRSYASGSIVTQRGGTSLIGAMGRSLRAPQQQTLLAALSNAAHGTITLIYGARDTEHNEAVILREGPSREVDAEDPRVVGAHTGVRHRGADDVFM